MLAAFCVACAYFTAIGLPLARAVAPRGVPQLGLAPALGWAVYMAVAPPFLSLTGFGAVQIWIFSCAALLGAGLLGRKRPDALGLPVWTLGVAGLTALVPAMAIMPKFTASGILLAPPMFDHVKIALVDGILRTGLPVPNPFYGPDDPGHLAYYYLWHVGTAMLASVTQVGGWAAEAAATGFTGFAALMLMIGLACAFGGGTVSFVAVAVLSLSGSMRPLLADLIGADRIDAVSPRSGDIGGWLNQAAWVPQHLAGACCATVSALLMVRLAAGGGFLVALCLGFSVAAGFESSVWVGGIGFAVAGGVLGAWLVRRAARPERKRFLLGGCGAAGLAALLILPMFLAEVQAARARGGGSGLSLSPYAVFGGASHWLDVPGFWFFLLPFAWPAAVPLGVAGVWRRYRAGSDTALLRCLCLFGLMCLCVAWLLRSTIDNNDLGWRAGLPALLVLTGCAAVWLDHLAVKKAWLALGLCCGIAALGVPDTVRMVGEYASGQLPGDAASFARSAALWQAVRRHTRPTDRIANNPRFVGAATPWPVNISWATLSDRPSCYAGWATVIAYGALPRQQLLAVNDRMTRVFDGAPLADDVGALAQTQNCTAAVITPEDGAWLHDPFANASDYTLAEAGPAWRIYHVSSTAASCCMTRRASRSAW
jgi:hypothetical protein